MNKIDELTRGLAETPPIRILITGGQGMLGHAFSSQILKHIPNAEMRALGRDELDVTSKADLSKWADWLRGGWLIHCAALVNVEGCARDPQRARQVIVDGVKNALDLADMAQARFFYPQSFLVFDGKENPIAENEVRRPLSLYGELKKEAEELVLQRAPESLRVVMAGFFGGESRDKNFVGKMIPHLSTLIRNGHKTISVGDRIWQPTLTDDLALNSLVLMAQGKVGAYQMACEGEATFAELTQAIIENLRWSEFISVTPVCAQQVSKNELGQRPARAVLSCTRLNAEGLNMQRHWLGALKEYLARPYFDAYRELERPQIENTVEI